MARPNQSNVGQRQVIDTIEDTSKYQTGYSRRLKVNANPLRIEATPEPSKIAGLAASLSSIKPELMEYAMSKQAEAYKTSIDIGKRKAQTDEVTVGEMEQFGYDNVKAVNDWTDFNQKVTNEYDQNFDKENGNLDEFLKAQWESADIAGKSSDYMNKFNPLVGKTLEKLRQDHGIFKAEKQALQNDVELTRMFAGDINDTMGAGLDYDVTQYESRREGLKAMFPGKTNSQLDVLAYQAVLGVMQETGDTDIIKVFKKPHSDGTPGLYEIPEWKVKIDAAVRAVEAADAAATTKESVMNEKALKNASDTLERDILFTLIGINAMDDEGEKQLEIEALVASAEEFSNKGIPVSNAVIKTLLSASKGYDKDEETKAQNAVYVRMRLSNPSPSQIASAFNGGDLSKSGFDKLMTKHDAKVNASKSGTKSITSNSFYKDGATAIKQYMGYATGLNAALNPKKVVEQTNAALVDYKDTVEALIGDNVPEREATKQATEATLRKIKEAGMESKEFAKSQEIFKTPTNYAKDPDSFVKDSASKALPEMSPKDRKKLQVKAEAHKKATKKLKRQESTK